MTQRWSTQAVVALIALGACNGEPTQPESTHRTSRPLAAAADAACAPAPAGLVSWWPAEESADDASENGFDGDASGITYAPGVKGKAFSFDGVDDYVEVPHDAAFHLTRGFSIETWLTLDPEAPNSYRHIVGKADWSLGVASGAEVCFAFPAQRPCVAGEVIFSALFFNVGTRIAITDGEWHHVAVTWDPETFAGGIGVYLDGVRRDFVHLTAQTVPESGLPLRIGFTPILTSGAFRGVLDELSIYAQAFTAAEVQAIYAAEQAGKCSAVPSPRPVLVAQPGFVEFGNQRRFSRSSAFLTVRNAGDGLLSGTVALIPPSAPMTISAGETFQLPAGESQALTVQFAPKKAGLFKSRITFASNTVGQAPSLPVIGEVFAHCGLGAFDVIIEEFPWWRLSACDVWARLRDPRYFGIERHDPGTGIIATDTELLQFVRSHFEELRALTVQVDYGAELRQFVEFGNGCVSRQKKFLGALSFALEIGDLYSQVSNVLELFTNPASLSAAALAIDLQLLTARAGVLAAEAGLCQAGKLELRQALKSYIVARGGTSPSSQEVAFADAIGDEVGEFPGPSALRLTALVGLCLNGTNACAREAVHLRRYFEIAFQSTSLANDAARRKAYGQGIARCAVEEWDDLLLGRSIRSCNLEDLLQ